MQILWLRAPIGRGRDPSVRCPQGKPKEDLLIMSVSIFPTGQKIKAACSSRRVPCWCQHCLPVHLCWCTMF